MRNYILNLFRLDNLHDFDFSYRLVDFQLPVYDDGPALFNKRINRIASQVSSLTSGPAAVVRRNGKVYVAIPADRTLSDRMINVVPLSIGISLLPEVHQVKGSAVDNDSITVISKFLDFEIRKSLSTTSGLWKMNTSHFFLKTPTHQQADSHIQTYEGFTYKLVRLSDGHFYICLDLSTKYIDKARLSTQVDKSNVAEMIERYRGRKFLYLNGENWYAIELAGFGESISEQQVPDDDQESISVRDYVLKYAKGKKNEIKNILKETDLSILYKYPNRSMEPHSGASSLAKMLYSPKDREVQSLHSFSIKDPTRRFESIEKHIQQYFQNIKYGEKILAVSQDPLSERVPNFPFPKLKFNNNNFLDVGGSSGTSLRDYSFERKNLIMKNGALTNSLFDDQFLIVPENMDQALVEAFKKNAEHLIKKMASNFAGFKVIRYKTRTSQTLDNQIQELETTLTKQNALRGFALFILPDLAVESRHFVTRYHDILKSKFYPNLKIQCASAFKIKNHFHSFPSTQGGLIEYRVPEEKKKKFASYLENLVFEHLIVNRKWPYALAKDLHYDIYIGIDVHDRHAGFSFFFKNGENIVFIPIKVALKNRSQRAEKLSRKDIFDTLYKYLKVLIPDHCATPNAIVIIRDGTSHDVEGKALKLVIENLISDGTLKKDGQIKYGVIDLHKQSSIPLRIASPTNGHTKLENPIAGAYKYFGSGQSFLFNTGFPFQIRGSAKPLQLILAEGNIDFTKVQEDIFCQSMLAFSAPDRSNSLPIAIKLIDVLLEPLSAALERKNDDDDEDENDEDGGDTEIGERSIKQEYNE